MPEIAERRSRILALETSCDETAAAVVEDGRTILANIVASQTDIHSQFGGVFPEMASRMHIETVHETVTRALKESYLGADDLDCVAVTVGPGLVGSLLVGVNAAKGIAVGRNIPLLGINHIEGHIYSLWLTDAAEEIEFPLVVLVVSGGHTELWLMKNHLNYELLGRTLDDAAGEAFDKVGRLLGLDYPGGPAIDSASDKGEPGSFRFPRAVLRDGYNFSFSGLKTAVMRETKRYDSERIPIYDMAASFQSAVVDVLVTKTAAAAEEYEATAVHIVGGVSANRALRREMAERLSIPVRYPPPELCTDNAAMIGAAAHKRYISGIRDTLDLDVIPNLRLA